MIQFGQIVFKLLLITVYGLLGLIYPDEAFVKNTTQILLQTKATISSPVCFGTQVTAQVLGIAGSMSGCTITRRYKNGTSKFPWLGLCSAIKRASYLILSW